MRKIARSDAPTAVTAAPALMSVAPRAGSIAHLVKIATLAVSGAALVRAQTHVQDVPVIVVIHAPGAGLAAMASMTAPAIARARNVATCVLNVTLAP